MIRVAIADQQRAVRVDRRRLRRAVQWVLFQEGIAEAQISLAIVDDATIRRLHRQFLDRDEPTDVLSFLFERSAKSLDGEIVVSGQTARQVARLYHRPAFAELLMYVLHGVLHLVGWRDDTPRRRAEMDARQQEYLAGLGVGPLGPATPNRPRNSCRAKRPPRSS
ncbi:MAG: rRNA maturation RNase YbeY [Thermoguttaceae bacterium]